MTCLHLLSLLSISVFFLFAEDAVGVINPYSNKEGEERIFFIKSSVFSFLFKMIYLPQWLFLPMHNFILKLMEIVKHICTCTTCWSDSSSELLSIVDHIGKICSLALSCSKR